VAVSLGPDGRFEDVPLLELEQEVDPTATSRNKVAGTGMEPEDERMGAR
jgi:hypothetical protein